MSALVRKISPNKDSIEESTRFYSQKYWIFSSWHFSSWQSLWVSWSVGRDRPGSQPCTRRAAGSAGSERVALVSREALLSVVSVRLYWSDYLKLQYVRQNCQDDGIHWIKDLPYRFNIALDSTKISWNENRQMSMKHGQNQNVEDTHPNLTIQLFMDLTRAHLVIQLRFYNRLKLFYFV